MSRENCEWFDMDECVGVWAGIDVRFVKTSVSKGAGWTVGGGVDIEIGIVDCGGVLCGVWGGDVICAVILQESSGVKVLW